MAKYSKKASKTVESAMRRRKKGTLKSGGSGRTVKSRKQAIAIGLSEARAKGAKVPKKKGATKKKAARKTATKKSTGRKSAARKGTGRKKSTGRTTSRRSTARKSSGRKKSTGRKSARKRR